LLTKLVIYITGRP